MILLRIQQFYIELVYNRDTNKIVEVKSFKTGKYLDKYLQKINTVLQLQYINRTFIKQKNT